ncbi:hypothetical protein EV183_004288 [Coemansia sp. RSA 2336]|nr:hypothetical protein EV183_004288 [Coemansia sp. RSA 2336]
MSSETDPLLLNVPQPTLSRYAASNASSATTSSHISHPSTDRVGLGLCGIPAQIDNIGSTARDFYAAERNYLSWLRLSMAIMSTGAVILANISKPDLHPSSRVADYLDEYKEIVGLLLFALAAFAGLAALAVFSHTQAQLATSKPAFVAASCLDLDGKRFRDGVTYEIHFDGAKGNKPAKTSVDPANIIIHPRYNPSKYSNNIAILQFSFTEQSSWVNYIAAYRDEWSDIAYVRRILTDADKMTWRTPKVRSFTTNDPGCEKASGLYRYNQDTFYCSRIYSWSVFSSSCNMPYGSIYGVTSSSMGIAGLYSHSVVYGTGICGGYTVYHYYIVLTNYLKYARSVLGRTPKEFVEDKDGLKGESDEGNDSAQNDEDHLSKSAIIAMSVVIPVGVILLAVIGFFLYKMYRADHNGPIWGLRSSKREKTVHALVDEIGGASHGGNLPSYENLQAASQPAASRLST